MPRPGVTRPLDIVVALRALRPARTIAEIASDIAAAPSQVHGSLRRLELAGLLKPEQRLTNQRALLEFLTAGVRYAFPAQRGALANGVPTAHSAPPLNRIVDALDVVVWPAPKATAAVRGFSLIPLYPRAPLLRDRDPESYHALCVVDALRLGEPRLRQHAREALEALLIPGQQPG